MRLFAFRLALSIGRLDVDEMLAELSPQQLAEWHAYSRVEPFGRDYHRTSAATARLFNMLTKIATALGYKHLPSMEDDALIPKKRIKSDGNSLLRQALAQAREAM